MRIPFKPLLSSTVLVAALATLPLTVADAQPQPVPPPATALTYAQREALASPAIRTQLALLRQQVQLHRRSFTVGYTAAMDIPLAQLAGVKEPPDALAQAARWAPIQAELLRADALEKSAWQVVHPAETAKLLTAPFTASSPRADWRTVAGVVPAIRNQGNCGSCWAFAILGAYESSYFIRNSLAIDASEQAVVSCSGVGSCTSGWATGALTWLVHHGDGAESDFPYAAGDLACRTYPVTLYASAWGYVDSSVPIPTVAKLKQAIVDYGPIEVDLLATDWFKAYTGGVFNEPDTTMAINHSVILVGWDEAKSAWILRNSWGSSWGETAGFGTEKGYMYIAYGSSNTGKWARWVVAQTQTYSTGVSRRAVIEAHPTLFREPPPLDLGPGSLPQRDPRIQIQSH